MTSHSKRYISIWLPNWPIECRLDGIVDMPFIQTIHSQNKVIVMALNGFAEQAGLQPGMSLATARAICAGLIVEDYEPAHNQHCLEKLADWAERFTPYVSCDGPDGLILDVTGCPHLFGGEEAMLKTIATKLSQLGHQHRLALTNTPAASWAASHFGAKPLTTQNARLKQLVEGLPVESLRLTPLIISDLHRMGLRLIKDVLPIARASLASRYGMELATRLDQLLGHMAEPITPRPYRTPYSVRLNFPDAIGLRGDIDAGLDRLIKALCEKLNAKAMGARRLLLICELVDKTSQQILIGTSEATVKPAHITRLFQEKLDQIAPGFGIDAMRLMAPRVESLKRDQLAMVAQQSQNGRDEAKLNLLIDCLRNRLGRNAVGRIRPKNSHLPDQIQGWNTPIGHPWPTTPPRPALLLNRPAPLDFITPSVTGKAPKTLRYKGKSNQISKAWGPERISPDWWRKDSNWTNGARDYYRVEVSSGEQLWIYRESQSRNKRWFLHGHFA